MQHTGIHVLFIWHVVSTMRVINNYIEKQDLYLRRFELHDKNHRDNLKLSRINNALQRNASCMDGSDAKYYISRRNTSRKWIIHLQSGGSCLTLKDCQTRSKSYLGSSVPWEKNLTGEWMLSNDPVINPTFYKWNKILIPYCSGDVFVGRMSRKHHPYRVSMLGHYIIKAVIQDLVKHYKINKKETKVLFGGTSAGGIGVLANIDHVAELVHPAKVKGYNDGGWFTLHPTIGEIEQNSNVEYKLPKFFKTLIQLFNKKWDGFVDETCRKVMPEPAACLYGEIAITYIKTPLFVMSYLWDMYQLTEMVSDQNEGSIRLPPTNVREIKFLTKFGRHSSRSMIRIRKNKQNGVFALACYSHTFFTSCVNGIFCDLPKRIAYSKRGVSAYGALSSWYRTNGRKGSYIDRLEKHPTCNPTCCSVHCHKCFNCNSKRTKTESNFVNNKVTAEVETTHQNIIYYSKGNTLNEYVSLIACLYILAYIVIK